MRRSTRRSATASVVLYRVISDPYCTNAPGVTRIESAVAVANQVTRRFVPGKGIGHLARDPAGGQICDHTANLPPSGVAKND